MNVFISRFWLFIKLFGIVLDMMEIFRVSQPEICLISIISANFWGLWKWICGMVHLLNMLFLRISTLKNILEEFTIVRKVSLDFNVEIGIRAWQYLTLIVKRWSPWSVVETMMVRTVVIWQNDRKYLDWIVRVTNLFDCIGCRDSLPYVVWIANQKHISRH